MKRIKDIAAKVIRIVTIPPVMVLALLLVAYWQQGDMFTDIGELLLSIFFLMVIPVLAYPLARIVPKYRDRGRDGERNLSFVMSAVGYTGTVIWGLASGVSSMLLRIQLTYFLSLCLLLLMNRKLHLRASGHACSIAGPLILLVYLLGWVSLLPCTLLFIAIIWASLHLKRHTPNELFWGSMCAAIAFVISFGIALIP